MGAKIDLTGQKFGRLTVIEFAGCRRMANNVSRRYWACKCDCGNEDIIYESTQTLRNGHALSASIAGVLILKDIFTLMHELEAARIFYYIGLSQTVQTG